MTLWIISVGLLMFAGKTYLDAKCRQEREAAEAAYQAWLDRALRRVPTDGE